MSDIYFYTERGIFQNLVKKETQFLQLKIS